MFFCFFCGIASAGKPDTFDNAQTQPFRAGKEALLSIPSTSLRMVSLPNHHPERGQTPAFTPESRRVDLYTELQPPLNIRTDLGYLHKQNDSANSTKSSFGSQPKGIMLAERSATAVLAIAGLTMSNPIGFSVIALKSIWDIRNLLSSDAAWDIPDDWDFLWNQQRARRKNNNLGAIALGKQNNFSVNTGDICPFKHMRYR